jgi:DhnA family fructose-bisphosphate aldolase class Ia
MAAYSDHSADTRALPRHECKMIDKGLLQGLIWGRNAFQRPFAEGVQLLNAIQDVHLDREVTMA